MIHIHSFTFGPFQENTYVLWDETKEALLIDPGNTTASEHAQLKAFIDENGLKPVRLVLTHGHVDHINGNRFVFDMYGLLPEVHALDAPFLERHLAVAAMYGLNVDESPQAKSFLAEGDRVDFGNSELEIVFTPGHSPGSITFYSKQEGFMIAGDVLFYGSIGRTDLPGGDFDTLIASIRNQLFTMDDTMKVYSGHGPATSIGFEKKHNPFLQ